MADRRGVACRGPGGAEGPAGGGKVMEPFATAGAEADGSDNIGGATYVQQIGIGIICCNG